MSLPPAVRAAFFLPGENMEYELMRVVEFLSENWSKWESFCEQNGDDADEIFKEIGGVD